MERMKIGCKSLGRREILILRENSVNYLFRTQSE